MAESLIRIGSLSTLHNGEGIGTDLTSGSSCAKCSDLYSVIFAVVAGIIFKLGKVVYGGTKKFYYYFKFNTTIIYLSLGIIIFNAYDFNKSVN